MNKGQTLIELVVAIGIFVITVGVLVFLVLSSYESGRLGSEITQADFFAQEGLEATRSIRDDNWQNLTNGDHGLLLSGGNWQFSGSSEALDGKFTRVLTVEEIDPDRKKITSNITWQFTENKSQEVKLVTYLTNWQKTTPLTGPEIKKPTAHTDITTWTTPSQAYNFPDTPNDQTNAGSDTSMPDANPAITFHTWAPKIQTYTTTTLKVNWRTNGAFTNDRLAIQYTKNGGTNWTILLPMGVHNEIIIQTSEAPLDANQNLALVQVRVVSDRVGGPDGGALFIYDIWTEGSF